VYAYRPPACAIRRVKRTITEARHRLPTPAITNATGTAAPAVAAAGAADTANVSASSASDWAIASALPSTPWRSSPTPPLDDGLFAMARCPFLGQSPTKASTRAGPPFAPLTFSGATTMRQRAGSWSMAARFSRMIAPPDSQTWCSS
jgi:hypothetical protein